MKYNLNYHRKWHIRYIPALFFVAIFSAICLVSMPAVLAVDELGLFELDGNALDGGMVGDDWETLYNGGGSADVFTGITPDPAPLTIFQGGRSKDIHDISEWQWKNGSVQDKADITNAYAAAYNSNGDLIVYFGADRLANNGDTFLGFWFFKNQITTLPNGRFDGVHAEGDTLVLVNFPQATNAVPLIQVVVWDPSCTKADNNNPQPGDCAASNLRLYLGASGAGAICAPGGGPNDQLACAITNTQGGLNDPTTSPWLYQAKNYPNANEFPYDSFFEGGINLTQLLGSADTCFSSFLAETRASSSFTATLSDFVLDEFPVCAISVDKTCADPVLVADNMITYEISGKVYNDGQATVYDVTVTDDPPFDVGSLLFDGQAYPDDIYPSLAGGHFVEYSATITVPLAQNGLTDTVTATAKTSQFGDGGTTLTATYDADCPVLQVNPALEINKMCHSVIELQTSPERLVVRVNFGGDVCNIGDSPVFNVMVEDDKAGIVLSGVTLLAPEDPENPGDTEGACQEYSGHYYPGGDDFNEDPTALIFYDIVTATGDDIFGNPIEPPQTAPANCELCP
jgi:hypothetical protein